MPADRFGMTSLSINETPIRPRMFAPDISVFVASNGFTVIFFDKRGNQRGKIFDKLDRVLKFVEKRLQGQEDE